MNQLLQHINKGDLEAVVRALAEGSDPNQADQDGNTPLHHCANYYATRGRKQFDIARALMRAGADSLAFNAARKKRNCLSVQARQRRWRPTWSSFPS